MSIRSFDDYSIKNEAELLVEVDKFILNPKENNLIFIIREALNNISNLSLHTATLIVERVKLAKTDSYKEDLMTLFPDIFPEEAIRSMNIKQKIDLFKSLFDCFIISNTDFIYNLFNKINFFANMSESTEMEKLQIAKFLLNLGEWGKIKLHQSFNFFNFRTMSDDLFQLCIQVPPNRYGEIFITKVILESHRPLARQLALERMVNILEKDWAIEGLLECQEVFINMQDSFIEGKLTITEKFLEKHKDKFAPLQVVAKQIRELKIKEGQRDPRPRLMYWLAYTAHVLYDLENETRDIIYKSNVVALILKYQNPQDRFLLVRQLSYLTAQQIQEIAKVAGFKGRLFSILLERLQEAGLKGAMALSMKVDKNPVLKDTKQMHVVIQLFYKTLAEIHSIEEQEIILTRITEILEDLKKNYRSKDAVNRVMGELRNLLTILNLFGIKAFIDSIKAKREKNVIEQIFLQHFQKLFPVGNIDNITEKYQEIFGKSRNPTALFLYLGSIQKLPEIEREKVHATLTVYVKSILEGKFPAVRYEAGESKPHLSKLTEYKGGAFINNWKRNKPPKSIDFEAGGEKIQSLEPIQFIRSKIAENHLDISKFPYLNAYLENTESPDVEDNESLTFQKAVILFCKKEIDKEELFKIMIRLNIDLGEFRHDIIAINMKKEGFRGSLTISETDHPIDLLLIGTEVQGSCQRVDGVPSLNKCLIAYLMNGEIKPIVIKDEEERIIARSILRVMWDNTNQVPVILQERIYSNSQDKFIFDHLEQYAIERAAEFEVSLVSLEIGSGPLYSGDLIYLGGTSPYIYSDALGGIKDGLEQFNSEICHILYKQM